MKTISGTIDIQSAIVGIECPTCGRTLQQGGGTLNTIHNPNDYETTISEFGNDPYMSDDMDSIWELVLQERKAKRQKLRQAERRKPKQSMHGFRGRPVKCRHWPKTKRRDKINSNNA